MKKLEGLSLKNVSLRQALDALLANTDLEYVIQEKYSEISNLQEELASKEQENIILQEKLANLSESDKSKVVNKENITLNILLHVATLIAIFMVVVITATQQK